VRQVFLDSTNVNNFGARSPSSAAAVRGSTRTTSQSPGPQSNSRAGALPPDAAVPARRNDRRADPSPGRRRGAVQHERRDVSSSVNQFDAGLFVNDDWRPRPNLTVGYGIRYEAQTNIGDRAGFAPRAASRGAWIQKRTNPEGP